MPWSGPCFFVGRALLPFHHGIVLLVALELPLPNRHHTFPEVRAGSGTCLLLLTVSLQNSSWWYRGCGAGQNVLHVQIHTAFSPIERAMDLYGRQVKASACSLPRSCCCPTLLESDRQTSDPRRGWQTAAWLNCNSPSRLSARLSAVLVPQMLHNCQRNGACACTLMGMCVMCRRRMFDGSRSFSQ